MLQTSDERNRDLVVNVGGKLTHRDRAAVSPFDSAVQGGDAVWEGLRLYDGKIFRLDEHLARLRASARALAFTRIPSDEEITDQFRKRGVKNNWTFARQITESADRNGGLAGNPRELSAQTASMTIPCKG